MSATYFAPAFRVKINNKALAADVSKYITSIAVTREPNTLESFNLSIANPYPDMPWTHGDQADLFRENGEVTIEMGYVDDLRTMFDGIITSITIAFPESGSPTVQVQGHNRLYLLQGSVRTHTYKDMTDTQIAQEIAGLHNLTIEADDTEVQHPYVIQENKNDLEFLLKRASLIRFDVLAEGKVLKFRKPTYDKTYTLIWGHPREPIEPSDRTMPLKHFTPTLNTRNPVGQVVVRGLNPTTREVFEGLAGSGDEDITLGSQTGADAAKQAFGQNSVFSLVNVPVASQEEAEQIARAIYNNRAMKFVTGNGATIGLPDFLAGQLVTMQGLGTRFNGDYQVKQATHTISGSGYETSFQVQRNAIE